MSFPACRCGEWGQQQPAHRRRGPGAGRFTWRTLAHDRAALERLLRYCARPPFAMERLRKEGAALVPPPRAHRHRYFGVLAPILAASLCRNGSGPGPSRTVATSHGAGCASHHGRGRAGGGAAGQCTPNPGRAGAVQAPSALPVGRFDRPNLRSVPAVVPDLRRADAPDRLYYWERADQEDSGSHRCRLRAPTLALPTVHFGGDSPRNDAVARIMSVSTWVDTSSAGRYLASCG